MDPILGLGLAALLLLVLMLVIAERKARGAHERRAHRTHRRELEVLTPEELAEWRAQIEMVRTGEIAALTELDKASTARRKVRSGEWKRDHPGPEKERDGGQD